VATNRAAKAGVWCGPAGNSGPGSTRSKARAAADAITACASTNNHFFGINVAAGGTTSAGRGDFNASTAVTAQLANWNGSAAGAASGAAPSLQAVAAGTHAGKIVVVDRGTCTSRRRSATRARRRVGVLCEQLGGDPAAMGQDGTRTTQDAGGDAGAGRSRRHPRPGCSSTSATANGAAFARS